MVQGAGGQAGDRVCGVIALAEVRSAGLEGCQCHRCIGCTPASADIVGVSYGGNRAGGVQQIAARCCVELVPGFAKSA